MTDVASPDERSTVVSTLAEITPEWLTTVLRASGLADVKVVGLETEPGETTFCIKVYIRPIYDGLPGPQRLFLKFSKPVHPVTTPDTGREVQFYRNIAPHTPIDALVRCYDAAFDPVHHRLHVLLEDVSETHSSEPPSQLPFAEAQAEMVVDALAQIHAIWWDRPPFEISGQPWPNAEELEQRIAHVRSDVGDFIEFLGGRLSKPRHKTYENVLQALPVLYTRLLDARGFSVVHDDVHIGNVLYPRTPADGVIRLVDWQTWHVDIAVKDLAHMMAVFWFPDTRRRLEVPLLERYHTQLLAAGVSDYDWEHLWTDYRLCVLRKLFLAPHQWATGHEPNIWWNHLERVMLAFDDLNCAELIGASGDPSGDSAQIESEALSTLRREQPHGANGTISER